MVLLVHAILMVLNFLSVALHTIGSWALLSLYLKRQEEAHRMFLINHSVCESIRHFMEFLILLIKLQTRPDNEMVFLVLYYIQIIFVSGICLMYYLAMVYITLDKLAKTILETRYERYWNGKKTKRLLVCTWLLGLVACLTSTITSILFKVQWDLIFHRYIYPTTDIIFILIAVCLATSIMRHYNIKQRARQITMRRRVRQSRNILQEYKRDFIIPVFLCFSFLFFIILPDTIYFIYGLVENNKHSDLLKLCISISYAVAGQVDACFYLFFLPDVRKLVLKKVKTFFNAIFRPVKTFKRKRKSKKMEIRRDVDNDNLLRVPIGYDMTSSASEDSVIEIFTDREFDINIV